MDKSQALRKLKENGTTFESFTGGFLIQIGKQIKISENGQKTLKVLTQAQQNKLLQISVIKQQEDRLMQSQRDWQQNCQQEDNRKFSANQFDDDDESEEEQEEVQVPVVKKKKVKAINKQPIIKYTTPQIDLEELIKLRTEYQFIKQQHIKSQKQINKYKNKLKPMKQVKESPIKETIKEEPIQQPIQEQVSERYINEFELY